MRNLVELVDKFLWYGNNPFELTPIMLNRPKVRYTVTWKKVPQERKDKLLLEYGIDVSSGDPVIIDEEKALKFKLEWG